MEIKSTLATRSGQVLPVVYRDIESEKELGDRKVSGVHAYCFYKDKFVVVYSDKKGYWTPPGGGVEEGEDIRHAVRREVKEETNMSISKHRFLGYQDIFWSDRVETQTRSVCLVEPLGPFVSDPDGEVTRIKLIDPKDFKKYFNWGVVGDHLMQRALEIKEILESEIAYVA